MALAVYGKHPGKGDFLEHGLPPALKAPLEAWLDRTLAEARETLGPLWEPVWAAAPPLCFWVGEGVWGEVVAGVLMPSRDRVGRRFPLVLLATGADAPPPPVTHDATAWAPALTAHLVASLAAPAPDHPAGLLTAAPRPMAEGDAAPGDFWAIRPGASSAALWQDVAMADHRRAAAPRSYWWVEGEAEAPAPAWPVAAEAPPDDTTLPPAPQAEPEDDGMLPPAGEAPDDTPAAALPEEAGLTGEETPGIETVQEEAPVPEEADPAIAAAAIPPAGDADIWALALGLPEDEGSPFDPAPGGGVSLFAAPEPGLAPPDPPPATAAIAPAAPQPARPAQLWAGAGLPPGAVLAWFFRGHAGNG